jgi:hypothetical protein
MGNVDDFFALRGKSYQQSTQCKLAPHRVLFCCRLRKVLAAANGWMLQWRKPEWP